MFRPAVFSLCDFGAVGNGRTLNTEAFDRSMAATGSLGRGEVDNSLCRKGVRLTATVSSGESCDSLPFRGCCYSLCGGEMKFHIEIFIQFMFLLISFLHIMLFDNLAKNAQMRITQGIATKLEIFVLVSFSFRRKLRLKVPSIPLDRIGEHYSPIVDLIVSNHTFIYSNPMYNTQ